MHVVGRTLGRMVALVLGALGVIVGFIANLVGAFHGHITDTNSHGVVGIFMVLLGIIATIVVLFAPETAALLFAVAGVGFFYVLGGGGFLVAPFFLVAAALAFFDRRRATK